MISALQTSENIRHFSRRVNPLTPRGDYHVTSPYRIPTLYSKLFMRILKLIR